ncbi:Proteinase inhibitor I25, cystatin, conserved site [Sesbania bispinosa]|nr:Proteinase inhibitor I25, cystatin, conserved site [Sesbania bispinosa]
MRAVILFLVFVSLSTFSAAQKKRGPILGGYVPIKDLNDPHVKEIANYAVAEYDKRSGAKLKLVKVVKGETQVVAGTNYRLDLEVTVRYQAVVWEKTWEHFRNLTSFKPLP